MKFRTDPRSFWKMTVLSISMVLVGLFLIAINVASTPLRLILVVFSALAPTIFIFTMGRSMMSTVTIDANGVTSRTFGRVNGSIGWTEMAEVGVGTLSDVRKPRYFLYFVTVPLYEEHRYMINRMKHNNAAIWMQLTEKAVELVEQYYPGEIHSMSLVLNL